MTLGKTLLISLMLLLLSACTSSHIILGEARPPIHHTEVKIYTDKPTQFETIAIVDASSKYSFSFTEQHKMDKALERLKQEAGKLGANGILLTSITDNESITTTSGDDGISFSTSESYKSLQATAIYVITP